MSQGESGTQGESWGIRRSNVSNFLSGLSLKMIFLLIRNFKNKHGKLQFEIKIPIER